MSRSPAVGIFAAMVLVLPAGPLAAEVKRLTSFEPTDAAKWGAKADGEIFQWVGNRPGWITSAKGDATEGQWALIAKRGAYLKSGTSRYNILRRQAIFNTYGHFAKAFPADFSTYDRLRLDVKSTAAAGRLRVEVEDEICQPLLRRVFAIPAGKWVTVEFNLAQAARMHEIALPPGEARRLGVKTLRGRRLNLAKMANLYVYPEQLDAKSTLMLDNVRLLTPDANERSDRALIQDERPFPVPVALPDGAATPPAAPAGFQPTWAAVAQAQPGELDMSLFGGTSYPRVGGITARAFVAADTDHMLLGVLAGYVHLLQTADGGKTWRGLDGGEKPTRAYHNANAPSHVAAAAGNDLLYLYTDYCAGGANPSNLFFRQATFNGTGWRLTPPRLADVDCRHCPEFKVRTLRLPSGRIWAAWMHLSRFGKTAVRARFSDDQGVTWRDPDSNAMLVIDRDNSQGPQQYGVTLWTDTPSTPPREKANGRIDAMHAHGGLDLVPFGRHVAVVYNRSWHPHMFWSAFDGTTWSQPRRIGTGKGGIGYVGSAAGFDGTIYLACTRRKGQPGQILRLTGETWEADTPPGGAAGLMTVAGDRLYCFFTVAEEKRVSLMASHKTAGGPWSTPTRIADETVRDKQSWLGVTAPHQAPGSLIPMAWGPRRAWVKFLRYPIR